MAAPAMAYDTGGVMSMQAAVDEATDMGLVSVSHTNFLGDEWEIEGRDSQGQLYGCLYRRHHGRRAGRRQVTRRSRCYLINPASLGSVRLIAGTQMISSSPANKASMYGT